MANQLVQLEDLNGNKCFPTNIFRGCKISSTSTPSITNWSDALQFSTSSFAKVVKYDTDGFYNSSTGMITIPDNVKKIIARGRITFASSSGGFLELYLLKNQSIAYEGSNCTKIPTAATDMPITVQSGVIEVVKGDTINMAVYNGSNASLVVGNTGLARITELEVIVIE